MNAGDHHRMAEELIATIDGTGPIHPGIVALAQVHVGLALVGVQEAVVNGQINILRMITDLADGMVKLSK